MQRAARWLVLGAALSLVGCQKEVVPPQQSHALGVNMPNWNRPLEELNSDVSENPKAAQPLINRGVHYLMTGKPGRASDDLTRAIQIDPTNYEAMYRRAAAYEEQGLNDLAALDRKQAELLDPVRQQEKLFRVTSPPPKLKDFPTVKNVEKPKELEFNPFAVTEDNSLNGPNKKRPKNDPYGVTSDDRSLEDRWREEQNRPAVSPEGVILPWSVAADPSKAKETDSLTKSASLPDSQRLNPSPSSAPKPQPAKPSGSTTSSTKPPEMPGRKDMKPLLRDDVKVSPALIRAQTAFQRTRQPSGAPPTGRTTSTDRRVPDRETYPEQSNPDAVLPTPGADFFNR
jgi:hypothetical protein